jgi:MerR family transcriptional regulator, light-induced transcriptional regulator
MVEQNDGYLRIGAMARRTGVSPAVLRAWEQRYGLLRPARSEGGFRLYSDEDEWRVRLTKELIEGGLSTAQAAHRAMTTPAEDPLPPPSDERLVDDLASRLRESLDTMDGETAHRNIDRLLASMSVEGALADVVLPYLRDLGERWASGELSVAQEHFASNLIRGRLLGIARDWAAGHGPTVILACPPGEAHDLGLIAFGIAISRHGWRVVFLGADTPLATIETAARSSRAALIVLAVSDPRRVHEQAAAIGALAELMPVVVGGHISDEDVEPLGARALHQDALEAARLVAHTWPWRLRR